MPFRFRFKTLLQHREYLLKQSQVALAVARHHYEEAEANRQRLMDHIEEHALQWEAKQLGGISVADYFLFRDYLKSLEQHLLTMEEDVKKAAREMDEAQKAVIEREKELKIMETLRDKDKDVWRYHQSKAEQRRLDETAAIKDYYSKDTP